MLPSPLTPPHQFSQTMDRSNDQALWVTHAVLSTSIALSLSLGTALVVEGTRQTASLLQSPPVDWKGCTCLLICCVLTPLVLVRWSLLRVWNIGNSNKYKTLTVVTILGMDSTDIKWLLMGMLPSLLILAKGILYISLSIAAIFITTSSLQFGFTYARKYRSTTFLMTLLVCLAACSGGHSGQLNRRPPMPLPLPLLHICRQPTYQTQSLIQPTNQPQAPYCLLAGQHSSGNTRSQP